MGRSIRDLGCAYAQGLFRVMVRVKDKVKVKAGVRIHGELDAYVCCK